MRSFVGKIVFFFPPFLSNLQVFQYHLVPIIPLPMNTHLNFYIFFLIFFTNLHKLVGNFKIACVKKLLTLRICFKEF